MSRGLDMAARRIALVLAARKWPVLIRSLPVWVFHGEGDTIVAVEESRRLVAALKAAGASVRYTEYPGEGHGQVPPRAWADGALVEWLFAQRRATH